MSPSIFADDRPDTSGRHAESLSEFFPSNGSEPIEPPYFPYFIIGQLRGFAAIFALGRYLKACRIGMNHLFAHRRKLKVADVVVRAISVQVIDRNTSGDRTNEVFRHEPMHQDSTRTATPIAPQLNPHGVVRYVSLWFYQSSGPAPKPLQSAHVSAFVDFIQAFVAVHCLPHIANFTTWMAE